MKPVHQNAMQGAPFVQKGSRHHRPLKTAERFGGDDDGGAFNQRGRAAPFGRSFVNPTRKAAA